jgi:DNA polymerase-1
MGHGLKELAAFYFDAPDYEAGLVLQYLKSKNDLYSKAPLEKLMRYNAMDVCYTWRLVPVLEGELRKHGLWDLYQMLLHASIAIQHAEQRGMAIDIVHLQEFGARMHTECDYHRAVLTRIAQQFDEGFPQVHKDFNPRSAIQVAEVMFDKLKLPTGLAGAGKKPRTTDKEVLLKLKGKHPFVDELRAYRRKAKLLSTYVENLLEEVDVNGRVHPDIRVMGTETGRLASFYHTIPRDGDPTDELSHLGRFIRGAFIAAPGRCLAIADYSQAELRVAAALSGEPFLLAAYRDGRDVHSEASREIFGEAFTKEQRNIIKMLNFSFLYGGSEYSMAEEYEMPVAEAREYVRRFKLLMPRLAEYREEVFQTMCRQGYVENIFGRRRRFPLITRENEDEARKAAMNMPISGTATDLTLLAACEVDEAGGELLLTVHDSIIIEALAEVAEAKAQWLVAVMVRMGETYLPQVPWKADFRITERWGAVG